jgi:hypothetical protein
MGFLYEIAYLADADLIFTAFAACVPSLNSCQVFCPNTTSLFLFFFFSFFFACIIIGAMFPFLRESWWRGYQNVLGSCVL